MFRKCVGREVASADGCHCVTRIPNLVVWLSNAGACEAGSLEDGFGTLEPEGKHERLRSLVCGLGSGR